MTDNQTNPSAHPNGETRPHEAADSLRPASNEARDGLSPGSEGGAGSSPGASAGAPGTVEEPVDASRGAEAPLEAALRAGQDQATRSAQRTQQAQQQAQEEAGKDWMGKALNLLIRIIQIPFMFMAELTRQLMGKVSGEDLVKKVRDAKRELSDLDEAHEHMDDKFSERMRSQQQEMSKMLLDQEMVRNDLDARREALQKERDELRSGISGQLMPESGVDEGTSRHDNIGIAAIPGARTRPSYGLPSPGQQTRESSYEEDLSSSFEEIAEVLDAIDASEVCHDIVCYETWKGWIERGIGGEDIKKAYGARLNESWEFLAKGVLTRDIEDIPVGDKIKCLAAFYEFVCFGYIDNMLRAAKEGPDEFRISLLRNAGIMNVLLGPGTIEDKAESLIAQMKGGSFSASGKVNASIREAIDVCVRDAYGDYKAVLDQWVSGANTDHDISPVPSANEEVALNGDGFSSFQPGGDASNENEVGTESLHSDAQRGKDRNFDDPESRVDDVTPGHDFGTAGIGR